MIAVPMMTHAFADVHAPLSDRNCNTEPPPLDGAGNEVSVQWLPPSVVDSTDSELVIPDDAVVAEAKHSVADPGAQNTLSTAPTSLGTA